MAGKTVNPTRMELTRLKGRLKTARRGHKLLKDKRDELMKQFLDIVRECKTLREAVEEKMAEYYKNFSVAKALMSEESMETALVLGNQTIRLTVDTKTMLGSLDRVSVVISEKLKSPVRCQFGEDKVTMSAKTANGDAKDVCRIVGDGQGLEIGFNNRYLMDALRFAPADELKLELNTGISPAILVPTDGEESFLYMVLPVRLKAQ